MENAQILWDFHVQRDRLKKVDAIFVMGSIDLDVPAYGIELYHQGLAPLIIFSGGLGNFTEGVFDRPEADIFADMARELKVPEEAIVVENKSTNSGENVQFTKALLADRQIDLDNLIAVQKPMMGKRVALTMSCQWPEMKCMVTSREILFVDYHNEFYSTEDIINVMVGDFERILAYPDLGYQSIAEIPAKVMQAYEVLRSLGYTQHSVN
ncbi:MAG: YdcF family protein [Planctomycetes bacterium]|nr:YdcF family protein [Planctomycetota bacterium]